SDTPVSASDLQWRSVTGGCMGRLYEEVLRIERSIAARNLDLFRTRGRISLRAGFPLLTIRPETPDDVEKLARLRTAAEQILNEPRFG
ncbi:MAG: hypothetical protein ACJ79R_12710, partial [Anaeromyxobacteraceae bacterium]